MTSRKGWGGTASRARDAVESRSRNRAAVILIAALAAAFLMAGSVGLGLGAPAAIASPDATPNPSPSPPTPAQDVPPAAPLPSDEPTGSPGSTTPPPTPIAPVILSPASGDLVSSPVSITGTGTPGGSLQILLAGSSEPLCVVTPDATGAWSCTGTGLASSSATTIRAVEPGAGSQEATVSLRVLNAPIVTGGPRGTLTNAVVLGSAVPGATVTATTGAFSCSGTADASGAWSCVLAGGITDGDYVVSASQTTPWSDGVSSPTSDSLGIQVDVTVPAAPQLLAPRSGQVLPTAGSVFSGSGEDGATVSIFAGAYSLCQVVVSGSSWSCTAAPVPAGSYPVAVLQQDPAGNVSVQSGPLTLAFQDATATTPGTPGGAGTAPPTGPPAGSGSQPGSPDAPPPSDGGGAPGGTGSAPGSDPGAPSAPGNGDPSAPGAVPPSSGAWTDATRFTASLQPALGTGAGPIWWIALAVGGLALLLVALPARLLAGTMETVAARDGDRSPGPRGGRVLAALLGRNRSRHEYDRAPELRISPMVTAGAMVLAAAAIVTLSAPVQGQPAYLRLFLAMVAALGVVNLVATVLPARIAEFAFGITSTVRLRPSLLLVSAGLALVSRLADLEPGLVFGLVAGLVVADTATSAATDASGTISGAAGDHRRLTETSAPAGKVATVQVLALGVLGAVAWLASGALGDQTASTDILLAAYAEFLHVVALASFGATSLLLLPIGRSTGRRLLAWSPATWLLLAVASFSALSMLFVPALTAAAADGRLVVLVVAAVAFAAVCVSAWLWMRWVADDE